MKIQVLHVPVLLAVPEAHLLSLSSAARSGFEQFTIQSVLSCYSSMATSTWEMAQLDPASQELGAVPFIALLYRALEQQFCPQYSSYRLGCFTSFSLPVVSNIETQ